MTALLSSPVTAGAAALAADYNNLRLDVIRGVWNDLSAAVFTKGLLTQFVENGVTFNLTYNVNSQLLTASNGTNTWTATYNAAGFLTGVAMT